MLLGMAGAMLFAFPLLSIANKNGRIFGIPLLYLYIFCVWLGLIIGLAILAKFRNGPKSNNKQE